MRFSVSELSIVRHYADSLDKLSKALEIAHKATVIAPLWPAYTMSLLTRATPPLGGPLPYNPQAIRYPPHAVRDILEKPSRPAHTS
jgi:hypothetical protein